MGVELPEALRPWADPLALFGEVVHDGLGRWLAPLRALLGPLVVPGAASAGEPDGYAGLSRRGSYERLLVSEWALALEVPEEFLRRAAGHEHLFMAPAHRTPKTSLASVALLDCGPWQLGAPRLGHLAALVVLQQRAARGQATLRFGMLQDPERQLHPLDARAIPTWLRARTAETAGPHVEGWREALAADDPPDRWLLGGPDLRAAAAELGAGLMEVEEVGGPEGRALRFRVWRPGRVGGAVEMALPSADTCVRILRAPLAPRRSVSSAASLDEGLASEGLGQLSIDGRRWLLPRADGGVSALHLPNTPAEIPGRAKQIPPMAGSTIVAADIRGKRPIALSVAEDGELILRGSGLALPEPKAAMSVAEARGLGIPAPEAMRPGPQRMLPMFVTCAQAMRFHAWIRDHERQLWELDLLLERTVSGPPRWARRELRVRDRACRSLRRLDPETIAWVSDASERVLSIPAFAGDVPPLTEAQRASCVLGPLTIHLQRGLHFGYPADDRLLLHGPGLQDGTRQLLLPEGRMFGLCASADLTRGAVLLVGTDEQTVYIKSNGPEGRLLFTATHPIDAIRHEPACARIVWHTKGGERGVFDLERGVVLRRLAADVEVGA